MKNQSIIGLLVALVIGAAGGYFTSHTLNNRAASTLHNQKFDSRKHVFRLMHNHRLYPMKTMASAAPRGQALLNYMAQTDASDADSSSYTLMVIDYPSATSSMTDAISLVDADSATSLVPSAADPATDSITTTSAITNITATAPTAGTTAPYIKNWGVTLVDFSSKHGVVVGTDLNDSIYSIPIENIMYMKSTIVTDPSGGQVPGVVFGVVNVELVLGIDSTRHEK